MNGVMACCRFAAKPLAELIIIYLCIWLIGPLGTKVNENWTDHKTFYFEENELKCFYKYCHFPATIC